MKQNASRNAYAKINLFLDVLYKRPDQYHELRTIFQSITLHDRISMTILKENTIVLKSNQQYLNLGKKNLVYQALDLMKKKYQISSGFFVYIHKRIPIAAGLGGGSADAAASFELCNELLHLGLSTEQLIENSTPLGSDIGFCLLNRTALGLGRGNQLQILAPCPLMDLIVAMPNSHLRTADVFKALNLEYKKPHMGFKQMLTGLENENKLEVIRASYNFLESAADQLYPPLVQLKKDMKQSNAIKVLMSGSGPTILGFYENRLMAEKAKRKLKRLHPHYQFLVSQTYNQKS